MPSWSPDGMRIAYATFWSGQLRIINADGTNDHAVPNVPGGWIDGVDWGVIGPPAVSATVDLDPDTLNVGSKGKWVTAYVELPDGYDVADIDVGTVTLDGTVSAEEHPAEVDDYDDDAVTDLMIKFDRQALVEYLDGATGEVTLAVSGELGDGTPFEGSDAITVINPGKG